jgi:hypothetical protein
VASSDAGEQASALSSNGKHPRSQLLANTDYDREDKAQRDKLRHTKRNTSTLTTL